jgi:alpha-tubulin suppressor-like RCC1 family protein
MGAVQAAQRGSLRAWGDNTYGQVDVPPGNDFVAVAGGWSHSLALKTDGSIAAWGDNHSGQCSVPSPNTGFIAIAAGEYHSLGLKSDGSIVAWGGNSYGQCTVPSPNTGFVAVAAGRSHSLGLKSDGSVVAWGSNSRGQCNVPSPNTGFLAVSGGEGHSLGLKIDGLIVAWGDNSLGQCSVPSPNSGHVAVAAGKSHSLGLKNDGSIVAWGDDSVSECNVPSPNAGFVGVAGGEGYSLGLKGDGSIVAWGSNAYGQCDLPAANRDFVAVAAGLRHALAVRTTALTGAGTDNYIPKWSGPSELEDSVIYQTDAGNIGIGTTSPACPLDVAGAVNLNKGKTGTGAIALTVDGKEALWSNGTYYSWGNGASANCFAKPVGIGTTSPQQALDLGDPTGGRSIVWAGPDGLRWYDTIGTSYSSAALSLLYDLKTDPKKDQYLVSYTGNVPHTGMRMFRGIHFFAEPSTNRTAGDVFDYPSATRLFIQEDGKVGIGTTQPTEKLQVDGSVKVAGSVKLTGTAGSGIAFPDGTTQTTAATAADSPWQRNGSNIYYTDGMVSIGTNDPSGCSLNVAGAGKFGEIIDRGILLAQSSLSVQTQVYLRGISIGSQEAVTITPDGELLRAPSSRRYKTNIVDLKTDSDAVLNLRPVRFQWKTTGQEDIGLIAEEVDETMKDLVIYDAEGKPDAVKYERISLYLMGVVKRLKSENASLKQRLEVLEAAQAESRSLSQRIEALEQMVRQQRVVVQQVQ